MEQRFMVIHTLEEAEFNRVVSSLLWVLIESNLLVCGAELESRPGTLTMLVLLA